HARTLAPTGGRLSAGETPAFHPSPYQSGGGAPPEPGAGPLPRVLGGTTRPQSPYPSRASALTSSPRLPASRSCNKACRPFGRKMLPLPACCAARREGCACLCWPPRATYANAPLACTFCEKLRVRSLVRIAPCGGPLCAARSAGDTSSTLEDERAGGKGEM